MLKCVFSFRGVFVTRSVLMMWLGTYCIEAMGIGGSAGLGGVGRREELVQVVIIVSKSNQLN